VVEGTCEELLERSDLVCQPLPYQKHDLLLIMRILIKVKKWNDLLDLSGKILLALLDSHDLKINRKL
jgi:hypothetical protein